MLQIDKERERRKSDWTRNCDNHVIVSGSCAIIVGEITDMNGATSAAKCQSIQSKDRSCQTSSHYIRVSKKKEGGRRENKFNEYERYYDGPHSKCFSFA